MTSNKKYQFWALMLLLPVVASVFVKFLGYRTTARQEDFVYTLMGTLLCLCVMSRSLVHKKE